MENVTLEQLQQVIQVYYHALKEIVPTIKKCMFCEMPGFVEENETMFLTFCQKCEFCVCDTCAFQNIKINFVKEDGKWYCEDCL